MLFDKIKLKHSIFLRQIACVNLSTSIVCISDTHSSGELNLPNGEILIHAGDLTRKGSRSELEQVLSWFKSLTNFRLKLIIAGNHDVALDQTYYETQWRRFHSKKEDSEQIINMFKDPKLQEKYGIIYLQDQTFVDPKTQLKFYGMFVSLNEISKLRVFCFSPWQPEFCAWAFNVKRDSEQIRSIWNQIPLDTDILITHGPPYGILDSTTRNEHVGCKVLYERLQLVKPKLHVFGHIHEAYGKQQGDGQQLSTIFVNAATCDLRYHPVQLPIVIDF